MWSFTALCDEFWVHSRAFFKLDLSPSRESLLHFFERIRQAYPRLMRLRRREDGAVMLDEESEDGRGRRYLRLEPAAMKFGVSGATDGRGVKRYAELVLEQAPYHLSLSELDYDYLDVVMVFELEYRGNHDELVAEALFSGHPLLRAFCDQGQRIIDCQPYFGFSLSRECETQLFVEVKGRTSTFEMRTGEYETAPLSVHLTARRYWGFGDLPSVAVAHAELLSVAEQYAEERVVPHLVKPLAAAIASRR